MEKTFLNQISIISQLISPSNRLHTIPTYLLETNQIDLLNEWVSLNTRNVFISRTGHKYPFLTRFKSSASKPLWKLT